MKVPFAREISPQKAFEKALAEYLDAAAKNPDDIRIHIKIAELYFKKNNKDKAISEYLYAANTYKEKKLFQIAISIYNHILSLDPGQTAVYTTLADIHQKSGFKGDAVATLEKLATYYHQNGFTNKAAEVLKEILEIDPSNEQFRKKVAKFYESTEIHSAKKPEVAETQQPVTKPLEEKPSSGFFNLEAALESDNSIHLSAPAEQDSDAPAQQQPYDDIFTHLKEDAEAAPDEAAPDLYYDLGMAQQLLGEVEEAMKEFEKAIEHNQKIVPSYLQLLQCCRTANNPEKAEAYISQALALDSLTEEEKKSLRAALKNLRKAKGDKGGLFGFFKKYRNKEKP
ncbi:MAG: tetratricopeptide repeat protein [Proteobacteria bacterium]|nr:tetratricopeptide repeat protein [Pseudomonadota bacterium]